MLALLVGVWVSSGSLNQEDVSLVFTENGFHRLMLIKQSWEDEPFPFQLPSSDWNDVAPSLWVHAVDLDDVRERMGFIPKQDQRPQTLLSLLAELAGRTVQDYQQQLHVWLEINSDYAPLVMWLQECNIGLPVLLMQLETNTTPEGLEVLVAMNALCFHIMIIQGDQVWSS